MRRYPYILSHETNVHPLFARMKARTDFDTLYGIESVILEFLNNLALVSQFRIITSLLTF